jgi:hypothetical protein
MQFNPQYGLYPILRELVNSSLKNQYKHQRIRQQMSASAWLNEFCTIKLSASRGMGHTTAGLKVMGDYFVKPLFLTTIAHAFRFVQQIYSELPPNTSDNYNPDIKNYDIKQQFNEYKIMGQGFDYDAIFVDMAHRLKNNDYEYIQQIALRNMEKHESFCLVYLQ